MTEVVSRQKSGKKPPKTPTKTALLKKCDDTFSLIVRSTGECVTCGTGFGLQASHGFSRSYRSIRWDPRNVFAQCRSDHKYYTHRPIEWTLWLQNRWGMPLYEELRDMALHAPNPDLTETLARLRAELDLIERNA